MRKTRGLAGVATPRLTGVRSWGAHKDRQPLSMTEVRQLWLAGGDERRVTPPAADRRVPVADKRLPAGIVDEISSEAGWWWLGVHGGAGVSTLRTLVPGGLDAQRRWPAGGWGGPKVVVLVCRTHASGLARARDAARQFAAGDVPRSLRLMGVVAVADSPGRLSRPQRQALRLLSGVTPRVWQLPWVEILRAVPSPAGLVEPAAYAHLHAQLAGLLRNPAADARAEGSAR